MQHKLALVRSGLATLGCATIKLHIMCLRVFFKSTKVDGCLPNSEGGSAKEMLTISKKVQSVLQRRANVKQCSKQFKKKEIFHQKLSVQVVLKKGKYPSTPEACPSSSEKQGDHWKEGGWQPFTTPQNKKA